MSEPGSCADFSGSVNWSRTALGAATAWPPVLRVTLDIVFNSPLPMLLCWGRERVILFNQAYAALAGPSHPPAPGASVPMLLPPPLTAAPAAFAQALNGACAQQVQQWLTFPSAAGPVKRECDLYFTPIRGERDGGDGVHGVLCALAPCAPSRPAAAAAISTGLRILVVEDNPDSQFLVCEMLSAFGHDNAGVADAEAALLRLAGGQFNVLFSDVSLPGMSGIELARRALHSDPQLQVIFASGYGESLLGQVRFPFIALQKPYELDQLKAALARVEQQLRRAPT
ncbi:MAG: response regulator [Massilia sp.]|nr:response regulator [Massilia sp.]